MDTECNVSFLKLFNHIKGIGRAHPSEDIDAEWLKKKGNSADKKKWGDYHSHYEKNGVTHPKLQYPVLFGQGDNQYPGMLALEDIN